MSLKGSYCCRADIVDKPLLRVRRKHRTNEWSSSSLPSATRCLLCRLDSARLNSGGGIFFLPCSRASQSFCACAHSVSKQCVLPVKTNTHSRASGPLNCCRAPPNLSMRYRQLYCQERKLPLKKQLVVFDRGRLWSGMACGWGMFALKHSTKFSPTSDAS